VKITLLVLLGFARAINVWHVVKIVSWSAAACVRADYACRPELGPAADPPPLGGYVLIARISQS